MKCYEIRRQINLFFDNELNVEANMRVLEHLNICSACANIFESEKRFWEAIKTNIAGKESLPSDLINRIKKALDRVDLVKLSGIEIAKAAVVYQMRIDKGAEEILFDVSTSEEPVTALGRYYNSRTKPKGCVPTLRNYTPSRGTVCRLMDNREFCWTIEEDRKSSNRRISHVTSTYDDNTELTSDTVIEIADRKFYYYEYKGYSIIVNKCPYSGCTCLYVLRDKGEAMELPAELVKTCPVTHLVKTV